ncbi:MAG: hypothetical protein AAGG68_09185 [Bacteroidota bacterium]
MKRIDIIQKKLNDHLKENGLNCFEEIIPSTEIEDSFYFCYKYTIVEIECDQKYWKITLGDQQFRAGRGHCQIGTPYVWLVHNNSRLCIKKKYTDTDYLIENFILRYKIYNSKQFYEELEVPVVNEDLKRAISLFYFSNIMDEYSFLNYLTLIKSNPVGYSKIEVLSNYEALQKKKKVINKVLIDNLLQDIPYPSYESEKNWRTIKKIINLDKKNKISLHKKGWREIFTSAGA